MATENSRELVKRAISHYAEFFKELASGEGQQAMSNLNGIREIDDTAKRSLSSEELGFYQIRRTQLMKTFRSRLFSELETQIEVEVLKAAEELVASLDADLIKQ
jgi:hypothetical protein